LPAARRGFALVFFAPFLVVRAILGQQDGI
jgi:hypothetical protein